MAKDDPRLYALARQVTDEVLGAGTYDQINHPSLSEMADLGDEILALDPKNRATQENE
jgi:hypothetical protein